jgi:hypothetical protein
VSSTALGTFSADMSVDPARPLTFAYRARLRCG